MSRHQLLPIVIYRIVTYRYRTDVAQNSCVATALGHANLRFSANQFVTLRCSNYHQLHTKWESRMMSDPDPDESHSSTEEASNGHHPEWAASAEHTHATSVTATEAAASSGSAVIADSTSAEKDFVEVDRTYLLVGRHTREHVCSLLGPSLQMNEDAISNMMTKLEKLKSDLRDWAASEIRAKMLNEALKWKLPVRNFREIKKWWADHGTDEAQQVIARIAFGIWDEDSGWEYKLERKYMRLKKWKYKKTPVILSPVLHSGTQEPGAEADAEETAPEPKGFVSRLLTNVKGDQVKQLQDAGKKGHGITITISRPSDTITKANKWKKRKKGEFHVTKSDAPPQKKKATLSGVTDVDDQPILDQLLVVMFASNVALLTCSDKFVLMKNRLSPTIHRALMRATVVPTMKHRTKR